MADPTITVNPDGTLTQTMPNGMSSIVIDPDGSYQKSFAARANPLAVQGAMPTAAPTADSPQATLIGSPMNPRVPDTVTPDQQAALAQQESDHQSGLAAQRSQQNAAAQRAAADKQPITAPPPQAVLLPSASDESESSSTSDHKVTTEGPDAATRANINQAFGGAKSDTEKAIDEKSKATLGISQAHAAQADQQYFDAQARQAGAMAAQQKYATEFQAAVDERKLARQKPIDPGQAFADDRGAYAMMSVLGMSLANVGRAWMGQAMQPVQVIDQLIDRSIKLQMAQKEQNVAAAGESADLARENMLAMRSNAHEAAAQALDARLSFAKSQDEVALIKSMAADQRAKADQLDIDRAKALATKRTVDDSVKQEAKNKMMAGGGAQLVIPGSERAQQDQQILRDAAKQAYPGLKPSEQQEQVSKFSDKVQKHSEAEAALTHAKETLNALTENGKRSGVPGYGVGSVVPNMIATDDQTKARQAIEPLVLAYEKTTAGGRMPPETRAFIRKTLLGGEDYPSMMRGLEWLQGQLDANKTEIQKEFPALYNANRYLNERQSDVRGQSDAGYAQQEAAVKKGQ